MYTYVCSIYMYVGIVVRSSTYVYIKLNIYILYMYSTCTSWTAENETLQMLRFGFP